MRYFLSLIALSLFSISPAAKAAEDPSLDTLFGFTNQPPQSGDQPQKEQPTPAAGSAPAAAPMAASPSKPNTLPQPEPLFGAAPQKPEPAAPVVQTPEPKPVAPVRILPSQVTTPETPTPDTAPQKPVMAEPTIMTPAVETPSKAEVTPPKAPEMPKPAPALAPTPVHEDKTVKQPAAPVMTPEPMKSEAESPAPSVAKEETVKPKTKAKAKTKPKGKVTKRHSKKKIQKKEPPKMVMSDEERRQKTRQMLEKSYDSLSMAMRIDFPAFSSALPRQSKVDLQDRVAALRPEEIVVLYGSASIGPKGTPNAARAVAQSRMDRVRTFLDALGVRSDRVISIDRSFTRQDSVDMAFVTVKSKRDAER